MCVMSMVYDSYTVPFDKWKPYVAGPTFEPGPSITAPEVAELRALIAEFREVLKAAKLVDKATGQPDCVDPAKAKLEERVAALEMLVKVGQRKRRGGKR